MIKIIKYYSYVLVFYTAEIIAFFILKNLFDYIYLLNFGLRAFFVATSSFFMRRDIFKNGKNFDIRHFHDEVLCDGGITLPILENKIQAFIDKNI